MIVRREEKESKTGEERKSRTGFGPLMSPAGGNA